MIRGLLLKTWRETWMLTLICGVAAAAAEVLLTCIVPQFIEQLPTVLINMPFVRDVLSGLLGIQLDDTISPRVFSAILWVHPVVFAILFTHQIMFHTRYPVAEIDRGTIDLLLGLPVSRSRVYVCEALAALMSILIVIGFAMFGHVIGRLFVEAGFYPPLGLILVILVHLLLLTIAVGGITSVLSSIANRRVYAVGWAVGVLLASILISFAAQWWPAVRPVAVVSVVQYYDPAWVLMHGRWPLGNNAVLLIVGPTCWLIGAVITTRRSICTV